MSAEKAVLTSVDLENGSATIETKISIDELFDGGVWRVAELEEGWIGFERKKRDGYPIYHYVDTTRPEDDWARRIRVGERSVLETLRRQLVDLDPFERVRGATP